LTTASFTSGGISTTGASPATTLVGKVGG